MTIKCTGEEVHCVGSQNYPREGQVIRASPYFSKNDILVGFNLGHLAHLILTKCDRPELNIQVRKICKITHSGFIFSTLNYTNCQILYLKP